MVTTRDQVRPLDARPTHVVGVSGSQVGAFTEATVMATAHVTNHLGATYAVLLLALADGRVVSQDSRAAMLWGPERPADRAWCPECRTRVDVAEASSESYYSGAREVGVWVTRLECGHETHADLGTIGASPGGESAAEAMAQARTQQRVQRAADWEWA